LIVVKDFYLRNDVVQVAQDLLGMILYTRIDGILTAGKIVETEAYKGSRDRASHAYPNKMTKRNSIMFDEGGKAYVYLIYGIHYLFNIVTNKANNPDAVLIRSLEPLAGFNAMIKRRSKLTSERITSGPGALSKAMGIDLSLYAEELDGDRVWLEYAVNDHEPLKIVKTTRIGVDYAGEDAKLPWRFYYMNNPWVSKT